MSIRAELVAGVATITIDRPEKLNALDVEHLEQLRRALADMAADDETRVIVLVGSGRAFSTGVDISNRPGGAAASVASAFPLPDLEGGVAGLYSRLVDLQGLRIRKPMVAAVDGFCLGGGLELALQCDLIVASDRSSFALPEVGLGSVPAAGGVLRLLRAVPRSVAMQMILTSERIDARRAYDLGLVSSLWPADSFVVELEAFTRRLADGAPLSLAMVKMLARHSEAIGEEAAQQLAELAWGMLRNTEDRSEGARAFQEKRPPEYRGR